MTFLQWAMVAVGIAVSAADIVMYFKYKNVLWLVGGAQLLIVSLYVGFLGMALS